MNNSPQDLLQLAPTVSDMSLIGYNRTSLSTRRVDLCYLMPSSGALTLMAQRGALSTGLGASSSQAGSNTYCHRGNFLHSIPPHAKKMRALA